MLTDHLHKEIANQLAILASDCTTHARKKAINEIVDLIQELEDICIAADRLENPGRKWSLAEVKRELGFVDSQNRKQGKKGTRQARHSASGAYPRISGRDDSTRARPTP